MDLKIANSVTIRIVLTHQFIHDLKLLSHVYKLLAIKK